MPTEVVNSTGIAVCNNPEGSGNAGPGVAQANPVIYDQPGIYYHRFPEGTGTVTIEAWGCGGHGQTVASTSGGQGGGGGAYAKYTMAEGLFTNGAYLKIEVSGFVDGSLFYNQTGVHSLPSGIGVRSGPGLTGIAGTNTIVAGTGLTVVTDDPGDAPTAPVGTTGGDGGKGGGPGGGAGGAGGAKYFNGVDGTTPGGGGGGGGVGIHPGGVGGQGRVEITW